MMQIRVDRSEFKGKMTTTPEGYIRGNAVVTRTGVFDYLNADGTIRRELRHPDDVFSSKSLATLAMIPVTVDHPKALLDLEAASKLSRGQTGENALVDGKLVLIPFTATHKDAIQAVKNGKKELSLGYSCDLLDEQGVYNGEAYTHRQTNIVYNHLAIVDRARAGSVAAINLDGASVQTDHQAPYTKVKKMSEPAKMATVNLDGLNYDAAPEVAKALTKAQSELETARNDAEKTKTDMQKEYDELKAKADKLKEDMEALKEEKSDEAIQAKVKARIDLERDAAKLDAEAKFDGLSDTEVMLTAIKSVRENFDSEGKSDDYIKAAFELAVMDAKPSDAIEKQRKDAADKATNEPKKDARLDAEDAIKNMWRKK